MRALTGGPFALRAAALLSATLTAAAAQPAPQVFDLDPEHSFASFEVRHFGTSTLRGRFGPVRGEVMLDAGAGRGKIALTIDLRTLDTGFKPLDARLGQADLLDVNGHPSAYFVAERWRFEQGRPAEITGEFTLRGRSVSLTLKALRFGCVEASRPLRCGGDFEGFVKRSDFGADYGVPLVADGVRILVQAEGLLR